MVKLNAEAIPPLRDGDRLTLREFMRRYEASPEGTRAELLGGVVHLHRRAHLNGNRGTSLMPPISSGHHSEPSGDLIGVLNYYAAFTRGVRAGTPVTVILDDSGATAEPDAILRLLPESGGGCAVGVDDYIHGPPELVVEVANTSAGRDLGVKYETYEEAGVREYIVWRTAEGVLDWFALEPVMNPGATSHACFPGESVSKSAGRRSSIATGIRDRHRNPFNTRVRTTRVHNRL